ncbi:MAG: GAF domain-containing protein [Bacteroidetes bacterium]|jgi:methyl-accepting chemotaxis protein|nr:GAF domain-containing protein [Bacteroidota bacterium]
MRLKIAAKIGLGFGFLTLAVIVSAFLTSRELAKSRKINDQITNVYAPSLADVNLLYEKINSSRMLVKSWVFIDKIADTPDKLALQQLHKETYPELYSSLNKLSQEWDDPQLQKKFHNIHQSISDTLFPLHQYVMERLNTFESYDDPFTVFEIIPMAEEDGEIMNETQDVLADITSLQKDLDQKVNQGRSGIVASFRDFNKLNIGMAVMLVIFALILAVLTIRSLIIPINRTKNMLLQMSKGVLPENTMKEGKDELGQMGKALNKLITALKNIFNFTNEIGKGNFDTEFEALSEEDVLGNSLLEMRNELKKAAEEQEKRNKQDEQRKWASEGIAKFSDILRQNNNNLNELSYNVVSSLVKYLNINQGGMFLLNNNDKNHHFLEMTACYAFSRQKFINKTVEIGEGLVGRCVQEKDYIYMTDIPEDYINITSGLGDGNPRSLFLIPLIYNDELFGVIELASFKEFPEYQIEFVKQLSESIAATILSVKSNLRTASLLEQSQQQAEEMSAQEEEMRQNMEELRATQEQSGRREEELRREIERLKKRMKEANVPI